MAARSPKPSPGESGSHFVDHTRTESETIRGHEIVTAACGCGGTDHHWIKYGPGEGTWVEVEHS